MLVKEIIEKWLYQSEILPITNPNWTKFHLCLFTKDKSSEQEYKDVKKTIRKYVPKGTSGVYIIAKDDKILYIGESDKNIHTRLRRHIDKIYIRTDSRSDFFKLEGHQGNLTIYYWSLPPELIAKRKAIEDLLTNVLEPEYKKWDLINKMNDLENTLKEINEGNHYKEDIHLANTSVSTIELEDNDFYDEFDKDDMLDRLGQHTPVSRKYWEKYVELNISYETDGTLTVNLGADDPYDLESDKAMEFATNVANRKGYSSFYKVEDDIRLYGQNCLTERMFIFKK